MKLILFIAFFFSNLLTANSTTGPWVVNPDHSEIMFKISYLSLAHVTGQFQKYSANVLFADDQMTPSKLSVKINVDSIFTGNSIRDHHLKSKDFLSSKEYPLITFEADKIKKISTLSYQATGILNIKEIRKEVTIDFTLLDLDQDTWGYKSKLAKFKASLNREDFGITWNKRIKDSKYLVGNQIDFEGTFQLQPQGSKTPASKHMLPTTQYINMKDKLNLGEITRKEFDQFAKKSQQPEEHVSVQKIETQKDLVPVDLSSQNPDKSVTWWLGFITLGFFGFIGSILGPLQIKILFGRKLKSKYKELGRWGIFTDLITIVIVFIYSWALWIIGWTS